MFDIRLRLAKLDKKQVWLLDELAKRGIMENAPNFTQMLKGRLRGPKAQLVLTACDEILKEYEREAS